MFDLCLHLTCSLKSACGAFKIDQAYSKTELDHKDVQQQFDDDNNGFYDKLKQNEKFTKYVYNDVISLKLIYDKYNKNISDCVNSLNKNVFKVNKVQFDEICNILTKGSLAYKMTQCGFEENNITFKPLDFDTYNDV